jgi:hypothetical protein
VPRPSLAVLCLSISLSLTLSLSPDPGCFRIGNTGGMLDNIVSSKLYRPGSVAYVSRSGGMSNELNELIARASDGVYEGASMVQLVPFCVVRCAGFCSVPMRYVLPGCTPEVLCSDARCRALSCSAVPCYVLCAALPCSRLLYSLSPSPSASLTSPPFHFSSLSLSLLPPSPSSLPSP